jgi:hypothetical protein
VKIDSARALRRNQRRRIAARVAVLCSRNRSIRHRLPADRGRGHRYDLNLISNFTFYLDDPLHGDQREQVDHRFVTGVRAFQKRQSSRNEEWHRRLWHGRVSVRVAVVMRGVGREIVLVDLNRAGAEAEVNDSHGVGDNRI